jgi:hypothetical protein
MPAYEGKGQPSESTGWFRGLTAWWNGFTPHYVTRSSGTKATTRASATAPTETRGDAPGAPSSLPASSGDAPSGSSAAPGTAAREPRSGAQM